MTLSPDDRADPGLALVRGPGRLGSHQRCEGFVYVYQTHRHTARHAERRAQREDRCLVALPKLKGGAAPKVANKLISAGFVEEMEAEARPRSGGAITKRARPTRSSSRLPGRRRSASMTAWGPRMRTTKPERSRTAIKWLSHLRRRPRTRPIE